MKKLTIKQVAIIGWTLLLISILFIGFYFFKESIDISKDYDFKMNNIGRSIINRIGDTDNPKYLLIDTLKIINGNRQISKFVTDDLKNSILNNSNEVKIIDNSKLATLLNWQKLQDNGLTDPASDIYLGRIKSPNYIIGGKVFIEEKTIDINLELIELETSLLINSTSETLPKRNFIEDIQDRLIESDNQLILKPQNNGGKSSRFFRDFFIKNWTWIWTVIVIPLVALVLRKLNINPRWANKNKSQSEDKEKKPAANKA